MFALVTGIALRAWFLFHLPLTSDQAIVGLMAKQFLHGHMNAFYWGQAYGGVEPHLVAAAFAVAGHSAVTLNLVATALAAIAALLVWRITLRFVDDRRLAVLAGALAWAAPLPAVYKSTIEYGFRGAALACGLAVVLVSVRILDRRDRVLDFVALGGFVGLGWWASPEIVYFLLPAALLLGGAIARGGRDGAWWLRRLSAGTAAFVIGALPWLWANVKSGFASLDSSKFPGSAAALNTGYGGRLATTFRYALPLQFNLRPLQYRPRHDVGTKWLFGNSFGTAALLVLAAGVIFGAVAMCFVHGGRARAIAVTIIAFPFVAALQPGTWYWADGRYLVYFGPLLAIAFAIACEELGRRIPRVPALPALSAVVAGCIALTLVSFHQASGTGALSFFEQWGHPDRPTQDAVASLRAQGVRAGYADYWVAYKLDFLSHGNLAVTVTRTDSDRSPPALRRQVARDRNPAWLFVPPARLDTGFVQFGAAPTIQGPGGIPKSVFIARLDHLGVSYRVVDAGLLEAVIPDRPVSQAELGFVPHRR